MLECAYGVDPEACAITRFVVKDGTKSRIEPPVSGKALARKNNQANLTNIVTPAEAVLIGAHLRHKKVTAKGVKDLFVGYVEPSCRWVHGLHDTAVLHVSLRSEGSEHELLCHSRRKSHVTKMAATHLDGWESAKDTGRLACKSCLKYLLPAQLGYLIQRAPAMVLSQLTYSQVNEATGGPTKRDVIPVSKLALPDV
jgi:hypothetical protein